MKSWLFHGLPKFEYEGRIFEIEPNYFDSDICTLIGKDYDYEMSNFLDFRDEMARAASTDGSEDGGFHNHLAEYYAQQNITDWVKKNIKNAKQIFN